MNPLLQNLFTLLSQSYPIFGIGGCVLLSLAALYAALVYKGSKGETYSVLNHFISELGEIGVSLKANVFNMGLIINGILMLPFFLGLGLTISGAWATVGLAAGVWTAVSCLCVGIFPMNDLSSHSKAAMSFFRGGLVTVILFNIAILLQPGAGVMVPKYTTLFGLLSAASYASFLLLSGKKEAGEQMAAIFDPENPQPRPPVWMVPAVEWAVFFSTFLWIFGVSLSVLYN